MDGPGPRVFRWQPKPAPRAKPIPQEQWKEHEAELRDAYQKMTLEELMSYMKQKHNFTPS